MDIVEDFLAQYPATISTVAAGATVAAVITALYLARRQSRAVLRVFADVSRYISPEAQRRQPVMDLQDAPQIITVTIQNVGPVTVTMPYWGSFVWSVPAGKKRATQNPAEPDFRHQPIELVSGKSASIVLSRDLPGHRAMMEDLASASWLGKWSLRFPRLTVSTEIGNRFRARLGKSLRDLTHGLQSEG
jgi:hypothetical protein